MARIAPLVLVALLSVLAAPSSACPSCPTPATPPPPPPPKATPPPSSVPCPPPPYSPAPTPPTPATPTPSSPTGKCPVDVLKLVACVDALNGVVHAVVGANASETCCPLLSGVADLDAALCLCTTIKAKALNVSLVLPVAISVLVNQCGKHVPSSFQCPS
ncbi:36.4 kDa proline-rich protein-like [Hordeum vulgare subsp. vulgare]|uniref:36.4 kDa proline-rich protein-like n=1 Tax=Hordeum vulgare subsp. vulgare TaxID=112509 RepID=UPI00162B9937|nr:36.4 kDa proline-rich protein-like [Hordeum vulgare subsp. vulgare]